jgi:NADH:ubiquinone oxidoreductase subunit 6 (subunit J)
MTLHRIIFIIFSVIMVVFSVLAVTSRKKTRASIFLLAILVSTAVLFFILEFYFLALFQLILYAGGMAALLFYTIRKTGQYNMSPESTVWIRLLIVTAGAAAGATVTIITILNFRFRGSSNTLITADNGGYLLPVIMMTLLLVLAFVAGKALLKEDKTSGPDPEKSN